MDVSDGLIGDCDKLAAASGCAAAIRLEQVPLALRLEEIGSDAASGLVAAGDDYEILAAVPPTEEAGFRGAAAAAGISVSRIGMLTEESGPTRVTVDGMELRPYKRAYVHGRDHGTDDGG
jgi:thiamine-monophosphate kinase